MSRQFTSSSFSIYPQRRRDQNTVCNFSYRFRHSSNRNLGLGTNHDVVENGMADNSFYQLPERLALPPPPTGGQLSLRRPSVSKASTSYAAPPPSPLRVQAQSPNISLNLNCSHGLQLVSVNEVVIFSDDNNSNPTIPTNHNQSTPTSVNSRYSNHISRCPFCLRGATDEAASGSGGGGEGTHPNAGEETPFADHHNREENPGSGVGGDGPSGAANVTASHIPGRSSRNREWLSGAEDIDINLISSSDDEADNVAANDESNRRHADPVQEDGNYDGRIHSKPRQHPDDPYVCTVCETVCSTPNTFAVHARSHYMGETRRDRERRYAARYRRNLLRIVETEQGLTLVPDAAAQMELRRGRRRHHYDDRGRNYVAVRHVPEQPVNTEPAAREFQRYVQNQQPAANVATAAANEFWWYAHSDAPAANVATEDVAAPHVPESPVKTEPAANEFQWLVVPNEPPADNMASSSAAPPPPPVEQNCVLDDVPVRLGLG